MGIVEVPLGTSVRGWGMGGEEISGEISGRVKEGDSVGGCCKD